VNKLPYTPLAVALLMVVLVFLASLRYDGGVTISPEVAGSVRLSPEGSRVCIISVKATTSADDYSQMSRACWREIIQDRKLLK